MKYFTICLSIFALLNIPLSQAYAQTQSKTETKIDLNFSAPIKKGMNLAKALSIIDSARAADVDTDAETKKGADQATTKLKTEGYDVKEYTDDDASIAVTFIIVIMMMITGPIFVAGCPKIDTVMYLIAAILMVVLEGVFWGMYEQGSKKAIEVLESKKNDYSVQLDSFKSAMEITQKAQTWMTGKFGAQVAIAVIVGIAMAIVLIRSIIDTVKSLGVEAATAQSCKASVGSVPNKLTPMELYTESRKSFNFPLPLDESIKRLKNAEDLGQATFINEEIDQFNNGAIKSQSINDYQIIAKDKELSGIVEQTKGLADDFRSIAESFLIPSAHAGPSKFASIIKEILIQNAAAAASPSDEAEVSTQTGDKGWSDKEMGSKLAAIGVGAAVGVIVPIALAVTKAMQALMEINGWTRAAIYGVVVVFLGVLASFSKKTADQLQDRADAYKALYDKIATIMQNPAARPQGTPAPIPGSNILASAKGEAMQELNGQCFTDGPNGGASADPSCGCKASKTCKSTKMKPMTFSGFKTPDALASTSRMAETMANQVYGGNMTGAMVSAQGIGRNAVAVKKMNENLMALANSKLAQYGKPTMDFGKMTNGYKNQAMKTMSQGMASLSSADRNAAIGAILGAGSGKKEEKESAGPVASTGSGKSGTVAGGKKKSIFDLIGSEDEKDKEAKGAAKKEEGEGKGLEAYEDSTKQIQDDGKASIFKIIEMRYMKSAYPVFFEKKDE